MGMKKKEIISRSRVLSMPRLLFFLPPTHSRPLKPTTRLISLSLMLSLHAAHEGLLVANLLASGDDHKVGAAARAGGVARHQHVGALLAA